MAHPFFRKGQLKGPVRFVFNGTSLEVDYVDAIKALLSATAVNRQKKYSSTAATAETVLCSACAHKPSGLFLLPPLHVTPFLFFFSLYCPFPFPFSGTCLATRKNFPATVFFSLTTSPLCHPAAADDDITKGGPPFLDKQVLQHALFASLAALCVRLCSGGLAHGRKQPLLVDFRHSVVISAHRTDALNIQLFVLCLAAQALFSFGVGVLFDFVSSCSFWF